ncbi:hypothetical protein Q7O56_20385 [Pseudomonas protegens]|uniref:hypothetical protein n=1 Tax=Pseudomonas protegens TaxID=380021 RepID=UPI002745279C|nr:hypothetical protein [Pseudomonas protegens]MDP9511400.1 hypothetical protein [Pseudomonas protegens]
MTVSTTGSSAQFFPNGATTHFPFRFRFFQNSDLKVFWQDLMGNIELLKLNSDYTVQGAGAENGGAIDTTGAPLPNGTLVVARVMIATQLTSFRNQGEFFAEIHEDAFDRLIMLVQQTIDSQGRGLTIPPTDPLDINLQLPSSVARADKILAFDERGQPIASNLSLEMLEQQPAMAAEAAAAASAFASAAGAAANSASGSAASANASKNAAAGSASAAGVSAKSASDAGLQLGMSAWGYRLQPFAGFALDDGQELERALYPDFAAAIDSGLWPRVTEAQWQADPSVRGCYVANSSPGKFRMRDLNGMSPGSFGAAFLRGSGTSGNGIIRRDQFQDHGFGSGGFSLVRGTHYASSTIQDGRLQSAYFTTLGNPYPGVVMTGAAETEPGGGPPRTGKETFPTHSSGAWMTRLYGLITPLGSAEASSLATAYAAMKSDIDNKLAPLWSDRLKSKRLRKVQLWTGTSATGSTLNLTDDVWNYETFYAGYGGTANLMLVTGLKELAIEPIGTLMYIGTGTGNWIICRFADTNAAQRRVLVTVQYSGNGIVNLYGTQFYEP